MAGAGKEGSNLGLESGRWLGSLPAVSSRSQSRSGGRGKKASERSTMAEYQKYWDGEDDSMRCFSCGSIV
jgi:hypothetical protein